MNKKDKLRQEEQEARRMFFEMIEASMALSVKKGKHPLTEDCNCIVCIGKRKRLLRASEPPWKYRL